MVKCKLVLDESVLSTLYRGREGQNVYRMIFFQPLWPRLWVKRGTVRVKCLVWEHNTMSPGRAWTWTWSEDNLYTWVKRGTVRVRCLACFSTPIYTPGWRGALLELSVLPENTAQCLQAGLELGPLDQKIMYTPGWREALLEKGALPIFRHPFIHLGEETHW